MNQNNEKQTGKKQVKVCGMITLICNDLIDINIKIGRETIWDEKTLYIPIPAVFEDKFQSIKDKLLVLGEEIGGKIVTLESTLEKNALGKVIYIKDNQFSNVKLEALNKESLGSLLYGFMGYFFPNMVFGIGVEPEIEEQIVGSLQKRQLLKQ